MLQVFLFVMAVLLANVGVNAACVKQIVDVLCSGGVGACSGCPVASAIGHGSVSGTGQGCGTNSSTITLSCNASNAEFTLTVDSALYIRNCYSSDYSARGRFYINKCDITSSSSSEPSNSSSSQGGPPLGGSCNFCRDTVDYSEFPPQVKHVIWSCDSCTAGEEGIEAGRCAVSSVGLGSCEDNNECPSGTICMDDSTSNYDCYAVIGANVYVRNRKNGNVFACEADGSCDMALRKVASGECKDPSITGEDGNSSSSGETWSSSEIAPASSSASADAPWGLETTSELIAANTQKIAENTGDIANYTQETMNKAIDIYNQQTEMQIDLSHVRTNTENTATNTGNIDTKLSTTNNLLNDIKNKNWSPQIHVGSPEVNVEVKGDTNIITVQGDTNIINADTSQSPYEILQFLKEIFSDTSSGINPNDTVGTADSVNTLLGSLFGDSLNQYNSDSLAVARNGYGAAFRAYKDTLNGIMRDSLNAWNNTLLNNGVLSGNGSDACPAFLMTQKTLAFGSLFTVQLPPLGQILCNPMPHTGITFWGLARTLLRMLVAIACMWWIYHAVIGSRGNDDED